VETLARLETEAERAEGLAPEAETLLESAQEALRALDREGADWDLRSERERATLAEVAKREAEDVDRIALLEAGARDATAALAEMVRASDDAEREHLALEERVRGSALAWEESVTRLNELRVREATVRNAAQEMELREARYRSESGELRESRDRRREEIVAAAETLVLLEGEIETRADGIEARRTTREECQERVRALERVHAERLTESHAREDEVRGLRRKLEEEGESAHRAELRLTEIHGEMERIRARIADEYGREIGAETGLEPPPDLDEAASRLAELRERRKSIGPVNALAVEEFETKGERLRFLTAQRDDLLKAKASLDETIRHINTTAAELFTKTCEVVAKNFKETFSVLFQGGEAELQFVGEDPLEADIEIIARPRGKRPQSIQLLSGGERALTAIALLFAIYLVKPSPFCILDEVDAPLDDANIDRFVNMLRTFSERTQFIVITHNKKTMEIADRLYGVTMRIPGVSQVVSVRLNGTREIESVAKDAEAPERRPEAEVGGRV
jgi:chromosome segregation protein